MPPHTFPEFYTREAEKQRENIYFLSLVFLILKMINNLVVTEIYLTKVIQSHIQFFMVIIVYKVSALFFVTVRITITSGT